MNSMRFMTATLTLGLTACNSPSSSPQEPIGSIAKEAYLAPPPQTPEASIPPAPAHRLDPLPLFAKRLQDVAASLRPPDPPQTGEDVVAGRAMILGGYTFFKAAEGDEALRWSSPGSFEVWDAKTKSWVSLAGCSLPKKRKKHAKCESLQTAGTNEIDRRSFPLGKAKGTFELSYETYRIPDQVTATCEGGARLWQSACESTYGGSVSIPFQCASETVIITVDPGCDPRQSWRNENTAWEYEVSCP